VRALLVTHVFPRSADDPNAPFLLRHAQGLVSAGVTVRVLAPHAPGLPDEHEVDGITVRRVRYGRDRNEDIAYRGEMHLLARRPRGAVHALRLIGSMAAAVRHESLAWRADVLDVHWLVPGGVVARMARSGVPVVVSVHGTDLALAARGGAALRAARYGLAGTDAVVAMSAPLAEDLVTVLGRRADAVTPLPAQPPPTAVAPPPGTGSVLAVGRLVPEKGHLDLVDAVAQLGNSGRDLRLAIVGEGPERTAIAERASAAGVPIELPGATPPSQLDDWYARADVVVVPSHREGFGLVAAEALLRGRPVVATDAGGLAEIVEDGVTGWSVRPRDPAGLARAIAAVLDDPTEATRRTDAGAARVRERWSPDALSRDAAALLGRVAATTRSAKGTARR